MSNLIIRKVAVLGAGVMGAQIAAHLVNARVPVLLFDLPAKAGTNEGARQGASEGEKEGASEGARQGAKEGAQEGPKNGPKNGIALAAIERLKKLSPAPLGVKDDAQYITPANYDDDLAQLAGCDLVIEAIAERMDWKHDLYRKVAPHLGADTIFASNTSGLSIGALSDGFDANLKARFCGVHFFNPPRYMHLVELVATAHTQPAILDALETFLTRTLGKGVVRAKDTPNFIANRVGVFSILAVIAEARKFGLRFDEVDDLTGSRLGRAKSATFRTADVVGLDTLAHVIKTMQDNLADDPFFPVYATPAALDALVRKGALGQKNGAGFYRKEGKIIKVLDPDSGEYVEGGHKADELVGRILKRPAAERLKLLRDTQHPHAQFLWAIFRDVFHYIAVHLASIADNARDVDLAIRWGFGWNEGPFESWQAAGWKQVAEWVKDDIAAGRALCAAPLPAWVFEGDVAANSHDAGGAGDVGGAGVSDAGVGGAGGVDGAGRAGGVHGTRGSWSPSQARFVPRSTLPVYARQVFRAPLLGEAARDPLTYGKTLIETEHVRAWVDARAGEDDVLIVSFKSKMNTIGPGVLDGLAQAIELAGRDYRALVVWQHASLKLGTPGGPFSAGANLEEAMPAFMLGGPKGIEPFVEKFQQTMLRVKYASVPVVAAVSGLALGGGCELLLHSAKRVAHIESYIGLVEVGVGLVPSGGGLKEAALRAADAMQAVGATPGDLLRFLQKSFENAATAKVSGSALEARAMGYLKPSDTIVFNVFELLDTAKKEARALADAGWRAPLRATRIPVAGRSAVSTIKASLVNLRDGRFISAHDFLIASRIAEAVCGGDIEAGSLVDEAWLLALERRAFIELLGTQKTQERIMGLLQTGKPVRN